ncbi:MAG: hypothetical protein HETSPECPRED_009170 [Heterodermia speciosa]|uniref:Apple domain-containing protein n=1 Tax=Heterodermia speciosa TaxID=116794 RepID=A0A8H3IUN0_9LECA|nr:MAG: hypothetical protein HETSPECPRED_009170 [Heterodermia speciosa]
MYHACAIYICLLSLICTATSQVTYKTNSLCTTLYGTKSVIPKSTGYKLTIPVTYQRKTTITPVSTITPPPATTSTTTTTTQTLTDTTTPTATITETTDTTTTVTATATSTSTISTTTTTTTTPAAVTIPTAAGYTPLANSPDYVPKKRSIKGRTPAVVKCPPIHGGGQFTPQVYPTSTICGTLVQAITTTTKTFTASSTSTTTLPTSTITQTSTSTATTTTTIVGDPVLTTTTTTNTVTATTTTTAVETTTSTATQTVAAPTPTSYAQCQSNNVIGAANGNQGIYQPGYASYNGVAINQVPITDPVQCCATCAQAVGCVGYSQYPGGPCFYYTVAAAQCDGSKTFDDQFVSRASVAAGQGYIIGNGQCGRLANAGSG